MRVPFASFKTLEELLMPLQNRVDPWGALLATSQRGTWMGNRGQLHNDERAVVRAQKSPAWIICQLSFKDRQRELMSPGSYTELFFLDEATALAAGHRPCFECRRDDADHFLTAWRRQNGQESAMVGDIDRQLSAERRVPRSGVADGKRAHRVHITDLPDGVIVELDGAPWLRHEGRLIGWSLDGYEGAPTREISAVDVAWALTPPSTISALMNGYVPVPHPDLAGN